VIRVADERGLPLQEQPIDPAELLSASEVFITNSLLRLAPVIRIDDASLPDPECSSWLQPLRRGVEELAAGGQLSFQDG
jgi:branched-subunit amino acid aminotransferase/4-amino-4-deoxychorismate lyase